MANYGDVQRALTRHAAEILEMIPLDKVQLSQPIDADKACICVSVEPGEEHRVPDLIVLKIGRKIVSIPIEVRDDYARFEIQ